MAGRLESLHAPLTLACGLMRVLGAVVEIAMLAVFHPWENLALSGLIRGSAEVDVR
jgi:hypothetical protein